MLPFHMTKFNFQKAIAPTPQYRISQPLIKFYIRENRLEKSTQNNASKAAMR